MFYNYNDRSSHISILMLMIIMIIAVLKSVKILTDDDDLYSGDREVGTADKWASKTQGWRSFGRDYVVTLMNNNFNETTIS